MEKRKELTKSEFLKFLLPLIIVVGIIWIFKAGYSTGQWLFAIFH